MQGGNSVTKWNIWKTNKNMWEKIALKTTIIKLLSEDLNQITSSSHNSGTKTVTIKDKKNIRYQNNSTNVIYID